MIVNALKNAVQALSALPLAPTPLLPPVVYGLSRISKEEEEEAVARSRVTRNTCPHPSSSCSIFSDLRHFGPSIHPYLCFINCRSASPPVRARP